MLTLNDEAPNGGEFMNDDSDDNEFIFDRVSHSHPYVNIDRWRGTKGDTDDGHKSIPGTGTSAS